MLRSIVAVLLVAAGATAQLPNLQFRQGSPSCGGAFGYPVPRFAQDEWRVVFRYDFGGRSLDPLLVLSLTPANVALPLLRNFAPGCIVGLEPVVWIPSFDGRDRGITTIGVLPPPWSNRSFSPFFSGGPLFVQMLGDCDPGGLRIYCLTESWSVTYCG